MDEQPVHIMLRTMDTLPDFGADRVRNIFRLTVEAHAMRPDAPRFQVTSVEMLGHQVHLVVRVDGIEALRAGIRRLMVRFAQHVNAVLQRKGRVWADRYEIR